MLFRSPGVSLLRADGTHDVMRGEETQVFGALDADAARAPAQATDWVLPGTHSKWVQVRADEIVAFRTYLTGELYAVLSEHSILGRLFARGAGPDAADPSDAFRDGVARATPSRKASEGSAASGPAPRANSRPRIECSDSTAYSSPVR